MMFRRAAFLRRLAAPAAASFSPLSTTAKRATKKAAVPAPEAAARDRPIPPHFDPAKVKRPTEIQFQPQIANTDHLVGTVGVLPVLEEKSPAKENSPALPLWNDLLSNPCNWWDNRAAMTNPLSAAFKHKDEGHLLWLNEFTPKDVLSKLDTLVFRNSTPKWSEISGNVKDKSWWADVFVSLDDWWMDVFFNSRDWDDNRIHKQNGTAHPSYPDFKHKSSGRPLWLVSAPGWVQSELDGLKPFGSSDLTHGKDHDVCSAQVKMKATQKKKKI